MKFVSPRAIILALIFLTSINPVDVNAQDQRQPILDYPELQVTPSASTRLEMEVKRESEAGLSQYLPFQVSALATLASGIMLLSEDQPTFTQSQKDQAQYAAVTGIAFGGLWLGLTTALNAHYHPYVAAHKAVSAMPTKSKKDMLARERMAEEALNRPAAMGRRMTWLSVATNLLASGFIVASAESDGSKAMGAVSAALAFSPVVFPTRWQYVADQHQLYKKRIYGPVVTTGVLVGPNDKLIPSVVASLQF